MALEGYLEDLGVADILQLVGLSKKSGTLTLHSRQREGLICFLDGQVIRASSTQYPEGLGQLLKKNGLVSEQQIAEALAEQRRLDTHQPLGRILTERLQLAAEDVERVVRERIETIVFSFFSWDEGRFSFALETPPSFGSALVNPLDFMLEKGLSPQRLMVKGRKIAEQGSVTEVDEAAVDSELEALQQRHRAQGVDLLRSMLAELEHPELGGGIILLILRYASEIMNRAIIFDVRNGQLVGLGQFGLEELGPAADQLVRRLRFDLPPASLPGRVVHRQRIAHEPLGDSRVERQLGELLAAPPEEVYLAPLLSDGEVVALLCASGARRACPPRAFDAFEVFLSRAGLALEQALSETA